MRDRLARRRTALASALTVWTLAGCVHGAKDSGPPDYAPIAGLPAPPNARLYADCVGQAAARGAFDRVRDESTELIRFTCEGEPARAFYDGLAAWSAHVGSGFEHGGRSYRATQRVRRDLFGVDYCSADGREHRCDVVLRTGEFLAFGSP
jgi:hypothetical protein